MCPGSGTCILESWICDGVADCGEGEDEAICGKKNNVWADKYYAAYNL